MAFLLGNGPMQARRSHQQRQDGTQYQYPMCFVCRTDVEAFSWFDHIDRAGEAKRTFFCLCHGEVEYVSLHLPTCAAAT